MKITHEITVENDNSDIIGHEICTTESPTELAKNITDLMITCGEYAGDFECIFIRRVKIYEDN